VRISSGSDGKERAGNRIRAKGQAESDNESDKSRGDNKRQFLTPAVGRLEKESPRKKTAPFKKNCRYVRIRSATDTKLCLRRREEEKNLKAKSKC